MESFFNVIRRKGAVEFILNKSKVHKDFYIDTWLDTGAKVLQQKTY